MSSNPTTNLSFIIDNVKLCFFWYIFIVSGKINFCFIKNSLLKTFSDNSFFITFSLSPIIFPLTFCNLIINSFNSKIFLFKVIVNCPELNTITEFIFLFSSIICAPLLNLMHLNIWQNLFSKAFFGANPKILYEFIRLKRISTDLIWIASKHELYCSLLSKPNSQFSKLIAVALLFPYLLSSATIPNICPSS